VTEDGTISAWAGGPAATLEVDHSAIPTPAEGAVFKGATIGEFEGKRYLYVANFRAGEVEIYDTNFHQVRLSGGDDDRGEGEESFEDERIPKGFAPFNIQNVGGSLFVTYAKQTADKHDDVAGPGLGFVDLYSPSGKLLTRFEHGSWLNALGESSGLPAISASSATISLWAISEVGGLPPTTASLASSSTS
jgi:uncharacterized protein (TIGR03118 family)